MITTTAIHGITWIFFIGLGLFLFYDWWRWMEDEVTLSQQLYRWNLKHKWIKWVYVALAVFLYFHFFTEYL